MEWNQQQSDALTAVSKWLKDPNGQQVFRLFGYAGTGKTTLAKHLAEGLNDVIFMSYTGKAAHVLRSKGCPLASTIHSTIYRNKGNKSEATLLHLQQLLSAAESRAPDEEGDIRIASLRTAIASEHEQVKRPRFELNANSALRFCDLAVVDEGSMVGQSVGKDICSFGRRVLALGDAFQLPPVRDTPFFTGVAPDVLLTDVERQARDNPVLHLATKIRNGETLRVGKYGDSEVITKKQLRDRVELVMGSDQILVGRNATRRAVNKRVRALKGFYGDMPVKGDKVVCLRNNHNINILNGSLWDVCSETVAVADVVGMTVEGRDDGNRIELAAWADPFRGKDITGAWHERQSAEEFDFGWGLTVHKAQGSQWNDVLLIDESAEFPPGIGPRHQYTGFTRASERITAAI